MFRRVCKQIDVENFRRVISNPDGWALVEKRDHCEGLYRNGTISWLGPHNFAREFKVNCALSRRPLPFRCFSVILIVSSHFDLLLFVCMIGFAMFLFSLSTV